MTTAAPGALKQTKAAALPDVKKLLSKSTIGGATLGRLLIEGLMVNMSNGRSEEDKPFPFTQEQMKRLQGKLSTEKARRDYLCYEFLERACWDIQSNNELLAYSYNFGFSRVEILAYVKQSHKLLALDGMTYGDIDRSYTRFIFPGLKKLIATEQVITAYEDIFKVSLTPMRYRYTEALGRLDALNNDLAVFCQDDAEATERVGKYLNVNPDTLPINQQSIDDYVSKLRMSFRFDSTLRFWAAIHEWQNALTLAVRTDPV